jgi:putative nucleotidyltransferase with HDIG domain
MPKTLDNTLLQAVEDAPLLSPNAHQLLQITSDPEHDLDEVIRLVRYDAALTARVLRVVNSAAFGLLHPVASVDRAVSYLGERLIVGIVLSDSVGKLFQKPMAGYEGEAGDLWRHTLFAAVAAREVARRSRSDFGIDLAFTGALLHDIGKSLITDHLQGTSAEIVADIAQGQVGDYLAGERERAGIDHAELGHLLACRWQLPLPLREAIRHHHAPGEADPEWRPLVYAVHLGDVLAMMRGYATGSDGMQYPLNSGYTEFFTFSAEDLAGILMEAEDAYQKAESSLSGG